MQKLGLRAIVQVLNDLAQPLPQVITETDTLIKLTKHQTPDRELLIRLEGQLTAQGLIDLRGMFDPAQPSVDTIVDLSGLTSVDTDGRAFLIRLRDAGVRLQGGSLYIKRLLQEVQP